MRNARQWTAAIALCGAAAAAFAATPLPPDMKIVPPADSASPEAKALSGTWTGKWDDGGYETTLVVEQIDGRSVDVIYSYGAVAKYSLAPGYTRSQGELRVGVLTFGTPNGAKLRYELQADGTLKATYTTRSNINTAILSRAQ